MYKQLKKMREEEGFTLIELLIVIVILGILAAIVVFSVSGITDRGPITRASRASPKVETAAEAFYANPPATGTAAYPTGGQTPGRALPPQLRSTPVSSP